MADQDPKFDAIVKLKEDWQHGEEEKDGDYVKFVCPGCGTDRLIVYYIAGDYSTWAGRGCPDCHIYQEVHSG